MYCALWVDDSLNMTAFLATNATSSDANATDMDAYVTTDGGYTWSFDERILSNGTADYAEITTPKVVNNGSSDFQVHFSEYRHEYNEDFHGAWAWGGSGFLAINETKASVWVEIPSLPASPGNY